MLSDSLISNEAAAQFCKRWKTPYLKDIGLSKIASLQITVTLQSKQEGKCQ